MINNNMARKFLNLIESTIQKMTNGGILVGDIVELIPGFKTKDSFKSLPDSVKEYIVDIFTNNDLNKKVINIKTQYPSSAPGNEDNRGSNFHVVVAIELANGLYDNQGAVTVPVDILSVIDNGVNRSPVPDSVRYNNKVKIKPELPEENEEQQQTMTQQGDTLKRSQLTTPLQNIKIPSSPATPSPAVNENYTAQYMLNC